MLRVSDETRERVQQIAHDDFGGASADEAIRRLLDEHWMQQAIADVEDYRATNPQGWADYLRDADELSQADAPITDGWDE
ncbi:MAG: hypothetical protein ACRDQA_26545 [Nocardioidaceae bacterium]